MKISVYTGPYLTDDDPVRDGVRIRTRFIDDAVASGATVVGLTTDAETRLQDNDQFWETRQAP